MNTIKLAGLGLGLAVAITGCVASPAGDPGAETDVESADVGEGQEALSAASVPTRHVYINYENAIGVTDDLALTYAQFDLIAGARVAISLEGARTGVGFKLYQVTSAGNLSLVQNVNGPKGEAKTTLKSSNGGSYVVETTSKMHPDTLNLSVDCLAKDGRCAPLRQPSDMCGGFAAFKCDAGLYCQTEATTCGRWDQSGTCAVKPDICTKIYAPVCGCDGKTYGNECEAASAGASIASRGACATTQAASADENAASRRRAGETCGGIAGFQCEQNLYCSFASTTCGRFDQSGTCAAKPTSCTALNAPVCGCDGTTYSNECEAQRAGTSIASRSACSTNG